MKQIKLMLVVMGVMIFMAGIGKASTLWKMNNFYTTSAYYSEARNYVRDADGGNPLLIFGRPFTGGGGIYNPTITTGNAGYTGAAGDEAMDFDGVDDISHTLAGHHAWDDAWKDGFVVNFYFNPDKIVSHQDMISIPYTWTVRLTQKSGSMGIVRFVVKQDTGVEITAASADIVIADTVGSWNHVIASVQNGIAKISVNGTYGSDYSCTTLIDSVGDQVLLGDNTVYSRPYEGLLDEVSIASIPEPAIIAMFGFATLIFFSRKK